MALHAPKISWGLNYPQIGHFPASETLSTQALLGQTAHQGNDFKVSDDQKLRRIRNNSKIFLSFRYFAILRRVSG